MLVPREAMLPSSGLASSSRVHGTLQIFCDPVPYTLQSKYIWGLQLKVSSDIA